MRSLAAPVVQEQSVLVGGRETTIPPHSLLTLVRWGRPIQETGGAVQQAVSSEPQKSKDCGWGLEAESDAPGLDVLLPSLLFPDSGREGDGTRPRISYLSSWGLKVSALKVASSM